MHTEYAGLTLDELTRERRFLANKIRAVDRRIEHLTVGDNGPYVVVRQDGATLHGHWANRRQFSMDRAPFRFIYRAAAVKVAEAHGATVVPFRTWQESTSPAGLLVGV
jgi:hypothetical protein